MKYWTWTFLALGILGMIPGTAVAADEAVVNVHSARKDNLTKLRLDKFTEQTGIKVKLGTVSLDGNKVKANASTHKALSWVHAN